MVNIYQFDQDQPELAYSSEGLDMMASLVEQRVDTENGLREPRSPARPGPTQRWPRGAR